MPFVILSLEWQLDSNIELRAYWKPSVVLPSSKGILEKEKTQLFPEELGSNEVVCIWRSNKCKLGKYMRKYREILLLETANPIGSFHHGDVS